MKKIIILYPHFPPSNLAGVHRPRFFAQHLSTFGWEPTILTVHEEYYEEELDWNLVKLLPDGLRIEKVKAYKNTQPRLIGDIGLRAFFQLYKKAKQLITTEQFDFLYIPIPSFYCALLGRLLHKSTNIKYGIDYIDPWVHDFPGSNKLLSRHWFSKKMADLLEPFAIKNAVLITGVAAGYYESVLERNPHLKAQAVFGAMPYGGEQQDHLLLHQLNIEPYLFQKKNEVLQLVYAGAMLPKAFGPLEAIFKCICQHPTNFEKVEFHFIGTGKTPNDLGGFNIKPLAIQYGLWQTSVFEYPKRIPYLDVLIHLDAADAVFILGSTEPHYTPSKTYQGVLSKKALLAVLHNKSSATSIIRTANAGIVLDFEGENDLNTIEDNFLNIFQEFSTFVTNYHAGQVNEQVFEQYSAKKVTEQLANLLNSAISK